MELKDVLTEDVLMEELGLTKQQVYEMRRRGLKCMRLGQRKRFYDANDVAEFLGGLKGV